MGKGGGGRGGCAITPKRYNLGIPNSLNFSNMIKDLFFQKISALDKLHACLGVDLKNNMNKNLFHLSIKNHKILEPNFLNVLNLQKKLNSFFCKTVPL